jgi:hypothetical protein
MFQPQVLMINMTVLNFEGKEVAMIFSGRTYLFQSKIKDIINGYETERGHIPPSAVKCAFVYASNVEELNTLTTGIKVSIFNLLKDCWIVYPNSNGVFFGENSITDYHSFYRLANRMGLIWDNNEITDPMTLKVA